MRKILRQGVFGAVLLYLITVLLAGLMTQNITAAIVNLAQGKTASASSSQSANPAANGNDGSTGTRWCAANGNTGHWWKVDLGSSRAITGSEVMWEFARNYKYKVEVSTNDSTWTLVVDKTAYSGTAQTQTDNFTATARYVRITVTGLTTSPTTWASFYEFRVFGEDGGSTPIPTVRLTPTPTRILAVTPTPAPSGPVYMESLDRGLIAVKVSTGVFLSWRLLKNEVTGYSSTGLTGANFAVYRNGVNIATVTNSANYQDNSGTASSAYYVRKVVGGVEVDTSPTVTPWAAAYYDLPIQAPPVTSLPDGSSYSYSANDMSVADVDGDGQYEYIVKWDPSNSKDVSQKGYTGKVYIDCYELNGTRLWRIDLGVNIRAGAHYTQFLAYDFNGDGKAEIIMKTAPGTRSGTGAYITMLPEDISAGYSNTDDYRWNSSAYYEYLVEVFKNWRNHPEVVNGHWPNTLEACFGIANQYSYPLSDANARALVNYFMDTYAPSRSSNNNLRDFNGFILKGPEYLTIFNGQTGAEMKTVRYNPGRDDDGLMWGDYALARIEPGNRVDRFNACVAYLDGVKPYAVFNRGYYTRTTYAAYSWDGANLSQYWFVDSGYPIMSNPFNYSVHGVDGRNSPFAKITTQGAHTLTAADVDGDGCDEIIGGAATIDHNGSLKYSSFAPLNGVSTRLGHGDSIHVTDIIPARAGLEIFMCHEGGSYAPYGVSMRDANTGAAIWGTYKSSDNGRCMIGDVNTNYNGIENWSMALRQGDEAGTQISASMPGTNANIKWAADMTTQIVNGSGTSTPVISSWSNNNTSSTVLTCSGTYTNNGTKGNPCLVADIFGDYREELLLRNTSSTAIRIYTNTAVSTRKMFTLMNDRQYRTDVARQNVSYNQPAYTSFYYASDINWQTLYNLIKQ
ncbi:MAG: discoidin domain-containing protein [Firmicutes bacterium]|nr:discoidin domain-containing protein [Bacillota bacterium]